MTAIVAELDLLGVLVLAFATALCGGMAHDVLLTRSPAVLRVDVYATAALAGSALMVIARRIGVPPTLAALIGGLTCIGLRLLAIEQHWNLPRAAASDW